MILVDTNAWIAHLRAADGRLTRLLEQQRVVTCDVVLGELALGSGLPPSLTRDLALLPCLPCPAAHETRERIERGGRAIRGAGVGWADLEIIVTAERAGALLYSADRAVTRLWRRLGHRMP